MTTEYCRKCNKKENILEWHQAYGMRLLREEDGEEVYDVRCPECGHFVLKKRNVDRWKR